MNNPSAGQPPLIINPEERDLIVATFKDNDILLKALRALFLQLGVSEEEKKLVSSLKPEIKQLLRERYLPALSKDTPIGQVRDVWLGVEEMVFGHSPDTVWQAINYKEQAIVMTKEALELLDNPDNKPGYTLEYNPKMIPDQLGVKLLARNQFIRHIETQLYTLWIIANQKMETPRETAKRIKADQTF